MADSTERSGASGKRHVLELGIEFCLELAIGLYQLGAEQMDLPHNFLLGVGLWCVATALAVRMLWIFPGIEGRPRWIKAWSAAICVVLLMMFSWSPVERAYNKQHSSSGEEPQQKQTPPPVQQTNQGNGNTNINGNGNTVTVTIIQRSDPKAKELEKQLVALLKPQQDQLTPDKLLKKYPLGYIIFNFDYSQRVFPYKSELVEDWTLDWSKARLIDLGNQIKLLWPDMLGPHGARFSDNSTTTAKEVTTQPIGIMTFSDISMKMEVLAVPKDSVVVLLGFQRPRRP
jgi:hypothetical protein